MFRKFFFAVGVMFGVCAAVMAGDAVEIDLNIFSHATLQLESRLPEGVTVSKQRFFRNPEKANHCYYRIVVDLTKTKSIDLEFKVTSLGGDIIPSASPIRMPKDGQKAVVKCKSFVFFDEQSPITPCQLSKWTRMLPNSGVEVGNGDTITLKAEFDTI